MVWHLGQALSFSLVNRPRGPIAGCCVTYKNPAKLVGVPDFVSALSSPHVALLLFLMTILVCI